MILIIMLKKFSENNLWAEVIQNTVVSEKAQSLFIALLTVQVQLQKKLIVFSTPFYCFRSELF